MKIKIKVWSQVKWSKITKCLNMGGYFWLNQCLFQSKLSNFTCPRKHAKTQIYPAALSELSLIPFKRVSTCSFVSKFVVSQLKGMKLTTFAQFSKEELSLLQLNSLKRSRWSISTSCCLFWLFFSSMSNSQVPRATYLAWNLTSESTFPF